MFPPGSTEKTLGLLKSLLFLLLLFNLCACCCCRGVLKYTCCFCLCQKGDDNLPKSVVNQSVVKRKTDRKKYPSKIPERAIPTGGLKTATESEIKVMHSPFALGTPAPAVAGAP